MEFDASMRKMTQYILCDRKEGLREAWKKCFYSSHNLKIEADIFHLSAEAMVSPANSFGTMRGGLDYYLSLLFDKNTPEICKRLGVDLYTLLTSELAASISSRLDWTMEKRVQEKIKWELPVGEAVLVKTGNERIPYLISAPTMRYNQSITDTDNVYLATKAIIRLCQKEGIHSVIIPGLGTGVGKMPVEKCALQMKKAFKEMGVI